MNHEIQTITAQNCDIVIFGEDRAPNKNRKQADKEFLETFETSGMAHRLVYPSRVRFKDIVSLDSEACLQESIRYIKRYEGHIMLDVVSERMIAMWAKGCRQMQPLVEGTRSLYEIFAIKDDGSGNSVGAKVFAYTYLQHYNLGATPSAMVSRERYTKRFRQFTTIITTLEAAIEEYYTEQFDIFDYDLYDEKAGLFL